MMAKAKALTSDSTSSDTDLGNKQTWIGRDVSRREDRRLLTGTATFVADVNVPGQLHMRVVRSTHAHARILSVDVAAAAETPGVRMVITSEQTRHLGSILLEELGYHEIYDDLEGFSHPVLADDRVLYVGQPVVAVLATDPYVAEDAAELVSIEYEPLPVLLDPEEAVHGDIELFPGRGNEGARIKKSYGDIEQAFAGASHIVKHKYVTNRHSGMPMEPRGIVVQPDPARDTLFIWGTVHVHDNRRIIARMLNLPEVNVRMKHVEIGGNFGVKGGVFPENVIAAWAAKSMGVPIKWVEDRNEHMTTTSHAREMVHYMELALDAEGKILGMKDEIFHNHGAYFRQAEPLVSDITAGIVFGPYRVPAYDATLHAVFTNKTPVGAYRAPGRYESTFARERIFDLAAEQIGLSAAEFRRRNLLSEDDLPWTPGVDIVHEPYHFDSGDVVKHFGEALDAAGWTAWLAERDQMRTEGRKVGVGLGVLMDKAGLGLFETGGVDVSRAGRVTVTTGASSVGQGIETVLAQIVAEELQIAPENIDIVHSDTELIPDGVGSWSSRSTVMAGGAARKAALAVVDKAKRLASEMMEVDPDDLELVDGSFKVRGADRRLSLYEIAAARDPFTARLENDEPGLQADAVYVNNAMNYPYGVTLVQIEVDPDTGGHKLLRFFTSTEAGRVINPLTTRGQIVGAAVQGIGGALYEEFLYEEDGQPITTSFMDYLLPGALEMPNVDYFVTEHAKSPDNSFGAKGLGEIGLIAAGAAVAAAIDDAIADGTHTDRLPVTPEQIFTRCQGLNKADQ
ncbi:6-hydroxypseudooxynicotine dehydrogenase complex subunit gamma [Paenarthrobacter sp. YIM B13468]|uniref:6-hydroxypseudooxynicotine dehydrogenase complex subunit gamma n=1 Tax=Paenarthrobacter sp. YIM B13468 TaxID=3366295 RepID=UPI00366C642C